MQHSSINGCRCLLFLVGIASAIGWFAARSAIGAPETPPPAPPPLPPGTRRALRAIRAEGIRATVQYLADDRLEGRDTGSPGGQLAANYLAEQLKLLKLKPAGDNNTYFQKVPFIQSRMDSARSQMALSGKAGETTLKFPTDFLLNGLSRNTASLEAPIVFAGYGITAPEYHYDDYAGLEVRGKVVVVLTGEPLSRDPSFFEGEQDTKYAAGGPKLQLAMSKGAVAVITILTPARAARFPWDTVARATTQWSVTLPGKPATPAFPALLIREEGARALFAGAETTWETVLLREQEGTVKPFPLPRTARLNLTLEQEALPAPNVVAVLEGEDAKLRDQAVVYTAHYDHIGRRPTTDESAGDDRIFNGAWDNASGTAGVLEVARGMVRLRPVPQRSVVFLFVTGEEKGLLGSRYYVRHPVFPMERTAANINLDMTDIFGIPKQLVPLGAEFSSLKGVAEAVAGDLGLTVGPDPTPELKTFLRSDQFSFVQAGVPSLFLRWSTEYEDIDAATAKARAKEKLDTIYHRVTDNFDPNWSWEGMRRHAQMALLLGARIANDPELPQWNEKEPLAKPRKTPTDD